MEKEEKKKTWYNTRKVDSILRYSFQRRQKRRIEEDTRESHQEEWDTNAGSGKNRTLNPLKSQPQKSNPFKTRAMIGKTVKCVCVSFGQGHCMAEGIAYKIQCLGEGCEKSVYKGETASNVYTRGGATHR